MQLQIAAKPSVLWCHLANKKEELGGLPRVIPLFASLLWFSFSVSISLYTCVGYSIKFPFIKHKAFLGVSMEEANLYKYMFVPDLKHQTLVIIDCMVGMGPCAPMAEMQCRLAAKVFKACDFIIRTLLY